MGEPTCVTVTVLPEGAFLALLGEDFLAEPDALGFASVFGFTALAGVAVFFC